MKKGTIWMSTGLLMILAALFLTGYNIWQEKEAKSASDIAVEKIAEEMKSEADTEELKDKEPTLEMPAIEIDGNRYIAVLQLPAVGIELPVMESWDYTKLRTAPCRYSGSVYTKDLIIAGHNYRSHFAQLKNLVVGDEVYLWDVQGVCYRYEVEGIEELGGTAVEEMQAGEWDLTLFTCTYGGQSRVTVRCIEVR